MTQPVVPQTTSSTQPATSTVTAQTIRSTMVKAAKAGLQPSQMFALIMQLQGAPVATTDGSTSSTTGATTPQGLLDSQGGATSELTGLDQPSS